MGEVTQPFPAAIPLLTPKAVNTHEVYKQRPNERVSCSLKVSQWHLMHHHIATYLSMLGMV